MADYSFSLGKGCSDGKDGNFVDEVWDFLLFQLGAVQCGGTYDNVAAWFAGGPFIDDFNICPMRRSTCNRAVRVGLRPTLRRISLLPGIMQAAIIQNAAEEKSPGIAILLATGKAAPSVRMVSPLLHVVQGIPK